MTLGKHGDDFDNKSQNSAQGYVETIKRGLAAGWSKENIGHHVVRANDHRDRVEVPDLLDHVDVPERVSEVHRLAEETVEELPQGIRSAR